MTFYGTDNRHYNYTQTPGISLVNFAVQLLPVGSVYDVDVTSSDPDLFYGASIGDVSSATGIFGVSLITPDSLTGSSLITITERNSGLELKQMIYKECSTGPRIYINPETIEFSSGQTVGDFDGLISEMPRVADIVAEGCEFDHASIHASLSGEQFCGIYMNDDEMKVMVEDLDANTGNTKWMGRKTEFYDTSGNCYLDTFNVSQEAGNAGPSDKSITFAVDSATTQYTSVTVTILAENCEIRDGLCDVLSSVGDVVCTRAYASRYGYVILSLDGLNSGQTNLSGDVTVRFYDTDGNSYIDTVNLVQMPPVSVLFSPVAFHLNASPSTAVNSELTTQNCTVTSLTFREVQVWPQGVVTAETPTIDGNGVTIQIPVNPSSASLSYNYFFNVGIEDYKGDTDTKSTVINITQYGVPGDKYIRLENSAYTIGPSDGHISALVQYSGCTPAEDDDPNFKVWLQDVEGDLIPTRSYYQNAPGRKYAIIDFSGTNVTSADQHSNFTVMFLDTDGYRYYQVVYVTREAGTYATFNPTSFTLDYRAQSAVTNVNVVNGTLTDLQLTSETGSFPEPLDYELSGNTLTFDIPENEDTGSSRGDVLMFSYEVTDTTGGTESNMFMVYITQAAKPPLPPQKDIEVSRSEIDVDSGDTSTEVSVMTTACTYSGFTYMTGGSFVTTATSAPDNKIVIEAPENWTNRTRTGYTYLTMYDTDGNQYQQTVTVVQAPSSSPTPPPDPPTGYVYTSFTITDNEQHRYFPEARAGITYSAAGQYYKTIRACEARYSLYYVNSYGGVDVLPFKGKSYKKTDNITRFNYSRSFRNNTLEFENVNYMNEMKPAWSLETGPIHDDESRRMHELVESTTVYLYDAEEKTYTPVVMTDKKLEYKTFYNQGRKFYNYTINVEESQSKERR